MASLKEILLLLSAYLWAPVPYLLWKWLKRHRDGIREDDLSIRKEGNASESKAFPSLFIEVTGEVVSC